jgi:exodeoxyribonuclease VII small subunit
VSGEPTLEQALGRLEEIVGALEREDLELEEALKLYEEGIAHLRRAQSVLKDVELRVERLVEEGGEPRLEPMPGRNE